MGPRFWRALTVALLTHTAEGGPQPAPSASALAVLDVLVLMLLYLFVVHGACVLSSSGPIQLLLTILRPSESASSDCTLRCVYTSHGSHEAYCYFHVGMCRCWCTAFAPWRQPIFRRWYWNSSSTAPSVASPSRARTLQPRCAHSGLRTRSYVIVHRIRLYAWGRWLALRWLDWCAVPRFPVSLVLQTWKRPWDPPPGREQTS